MLVHIVSLVMGLDRLRGPPDSAKGCVMLGIFQLPIRPSLRIADRLSDEVAVSCELRVKTFVAES